MRSTLALAALLVALLPCHARGECTKAAPDVIAAAEQAAGEAEHKADQAESVAVRSGNPGAARRAELARREADLARRHALELACQPVPPPAPAKKPGFGY